MHGDLMLTLARHARLPGALLAALFVAACPAPQSEDEATEAAEAEAQQRYERLELHWRDTIGRA